MNRSTIWLVQKAHEERDPGRAALLGGGGKTDKRRFLDRDFEERFRDECWELRQDQVTRPKLVASYEPSQVLSEGEPKALRTIRRRSLNIADTPGDSTRVATFRMSATPAGASRKCEGTSKTSVTAGLRYSTRANIYHVQL